MTQMTATGATTEISRGYAAFGDSEKSEGRGPRVELNCFTDLDEAVDASRGQGVQGGDGTVSEVVWLLHEGGLVTRREMPMRGHRKSPDGKRWETGWLDYRDASGGAPT